LPGRAADYFINGVLLRGTPFSILGSFRIVGQFSIYPKLCEVSGISYPDLIDRLIQLALERYEQEKYINWGFTESE
jgi:hypothetical protein